jgi:hypothetical protein
MDIQEEMAQIITEATVDETPAEPEKSETPSEPESVPAPTEEPKKTFKVKHNKQEVELTEEQANEAIQYGLYVKDRGGITPIKWFDEQAKAAGFDSLAAYQKALKEASEQREVARLVEEDSLPEEVATELVQLRMEKAERAKAEAEQTTEAVDANLVNEVREFNKLFPDVDVENLPAEVLAEKQANRSRSIVDIYARYAVQQYNKNRQIEESQRKAAETSTPSLQGVADSPDLYAFIDDIIFKKKE